MAYLLSIYPHETFDPWLTPNFVPDVSLTETSVNPTWNTVLSVLRYFVPSYFQDVPPPVEKAFAPIPPKVTPTQLKKALVILSTRGILTDVGKDSPNLLVFNNFTDASLLFQ